MHRSDFGGYFVNEYRVDAESGARGEGFSREFEQDSFVHVRSKYRMAVLSCQLSVVSEETL
jgi:hypothetical protein